MRALCLLLLFASGALAQPGNPMPPPDPDEVAVQIPMIAWLALFGLMWATLSEKGPLHKWADANPWLAVLLVIVGPIVIGIVAK